MAKINYAKLYTLRSDGRYQGYWHELDRDGKPTGKRHAICDRDPERLCQRIAEKEKSRACDFKTIAEQWRGARFEKLSSKSVEAYKAPLRRLEDQFGDREIENIETYDVAAFLQSLAAKQYARRTVQLHRDMMSQIFNYAIAEGLTRYNPCDHVSMPKGLSSGTRGIPSDEAIEAVKKGLNEPFGLFAYICLYAGLRRGECLALRYEDVDRKANVIHVNKAVEFISNNPHIKEPKTKAGKRCVLLPDVLANAIPKNKKGYIFTNQNGDLLTRQGYSCRWETYCRHIGHKVTAHQLRHGYATFLYEAKIADKDMQELLGHADINTTKNIYTHIRDSHRSEVAATFNEFLSNDDGKNDGKS